MSLIPPTYLFFLFLFIVAIAIGGIIANERFKKEKGQRQFQILPYVEKLLQQLNCKYEHSKSESWHEFTFSFQNGNFIVLCKEDDYNIRIHYPHFFTTSIDYLDNVRELCNICNAHSGSHHVLYTTDGKENSITAHITSSLAVFEENPLHTDYLSNVLSRFFSIAQEFYLRFDKSKVQAKGNLPYDIEKDYLKYEREFFMLKEMEICHQTSDVQIRTNNQAPLCLGKMLSVLFSWKNTEFLELKVVTHELKTLVSAQQISDFDIGKVIVSLDANNQPVFIGNNATLILTFSTEENKTDIPEQLIITLHNEGRTSETLYQRIFINSPSANPHYKNPEMNRTVPERNITFLFAYDKTNIDEKVTAVRDIISTLQKKEDVSYNQDTPEEQKVVDRSLHPDLQDICNYGVCLFRQKRYYEAIVELEYVYNYLSLHFQTFNAKEQNFFYEICYYIGFSYSELGLNKRAYYYLDPVFQINNLTYMQAYVNCLVNAKDFRTLSVIDHLSRILQSQIKEDTEEIPDNIKRFLNFLQRRKAHHLVDLGYYSKAKEIYEILYLDPESQDFALNELAFLQKIDEKGKDNKDHTTKQ